MCSGDRPTSFSSSRTRSLICRRLESPWMRRGSAMMVPTRLRGFSDAYGSWKTICTSPRIGRSAPGEPRDVLAVEDDRSAGQLLPPDDATAEGGFAAAGLADQAERLPGPDLDADVVDGVHPAHLALEHDPALDREVLLQMLDPQQHVPG